MASMILTPSLSQKISINANAAVQVSLDLLSKKAQNAANQALQALQDFFQCLKQSFKTTLLLSPLNVRVGFSFRAVPIKYRIILSVTLMTITNIFFATIKFFRMLKRKDSSSEQQVYNFLNAILKEDLIEELKQGFLEALDDLIKNDNPNPEFILKQISNLPIGFKELLYQKTRTHSLSRLNKESIGAFDRVWNEKFAEFCQTHTHKKIADFHIKTKWQYSLLQYLDHRIERETVLAPLTEETKFTSIPSSVTISILYDWFEKIDWSNKKSTFYLRKQTDPDEPGQQLSKKDLKDRIKKALSYIEKRQPTIGAPPANTKEFDIFYDNLENKLKACIWHLQKEEQRLLEKCKGKLGEIVDEETKREFMFLCENKGRLCCQIGIAGAHCPVRLSGEISQEYNKLFSAVSSSDEEVLSLEQLIINCLGNFRLEIAQEEIAAINPDNDTHNYAAYMEAVGQPFNVPGSKGQVEHLQKFSESDIITESLYFRKKYTSENLIKRIQSFYRTSYHFREKVQAWIQDRAEGWEHDKYNRLFITIQNEINEKLAELENLSVNNHPATDLYISILRQIKPNTEIIVNEETGERANLDELVTRLEKKKISFDDFKNYLFSLDQVKKIIAALHFNTQSKKPAALVKQELLIQLKDLDCDEDLVQIAMSILKKNESLEKEAVKSLSKKLTKNSVIVALVKITAKHALTHIDFENYEDDAAFAKSLMHAIVLKQKSDYLTHCLEGIESDNIIPAKLAEELLVHYRVLKSLTEVSHQRSI